MVSCSRWSRAGLPIWHFWSQILKVRLFLKIKNTSQNLAFFQSERLGSGKTLSELHIYYKFLLTGVHDHSAVVPNLFWPKICFSNSHPPEIYQSFLNTAHWHTSFPACSNWLHSTFSCCHNHWTSNHKPRQFMSQTNTHTPICLIRKDLNMDMGVGRIFFRGNGEFFQG